MMNMQKKIETLLKERKLTKAQFADLMDVQPWTVGAWISGERSIAAKHMHKIMYYLALPKEADLIYFPTADLFTKKVNEAKISQACPVQTSLIKVIDAGIKFRNCLQPAKKIKLPTKMAEDFLSGLSANELSELMGILSSKLQRRLKFDSLNPAEFVTEIQRESKLGNGTNFEIILEDNGYAYISLYFDFELGNYSRSEADIYFENFFSGDHDDMGQFVDYSFDDLLTKLEIDLDTIEQVREKHLYEAKDDHRTWCNEISEKIFEETVFTSDSINNQWLGDDLYLVSYSADFKLASFMSDVEVVIRRYQQWA